MMTDAVKTQTSGLKKWRKIALGVTGGLILAAGAGVWAVNDYLSRDNVKMLVAEAASQALGRTISINGELTMGLSMTPTIVATNVTVSNAEWGSRPQMATAKRFEMKLNLKALTEEGRLDVTQLSLIEPDVYLETNHRGEGNWESEAIEDMGFENLPTKNKADQTRLAVLAAFEERDNGVVTQEEPFSFASLLPYNIDHIDRIDVHRVEIIKGLVTYRNGTDKVKVVLPVEEMTAEVEQADGVLNLSKLFAKIGGSDLSGNLSLNASGHRPRLAGSLRSNTLVGKDFVLAAGAGMERVAATEGRLIPADRYSLDWMRVADAEIKLSVKALHTKNTTLRDVSASVSLKGGVLNLRPVKAKVAGGDVAIIAKIDARQKHDARLSADVEVNKLNAGALFTDLGMDGFIVGGSTDARMRLTSAGQSPRALLANLDGDVLMLMGSGEIHQDAVDLEGADHMMNAVHGLNGAGSFVRGGGSQIGLLLGGVSLVSEVAQAVSANGESANTTKLHCAVINVPIRKGVATSDASIAVETAEKTVVANGIIDFGEEHVDLTILPQNKNLLGLNVKPLADPLRVRGPFIQPDIGVNENSLAVTVASIGLAIATGGASAVMETVVGLASADATPCQTALSR